MIFRFFANNSRYPLIDQFSSLRIILMLKFCLCWLLNEFGDNLYTRSSGAIGFKSNPNQMMSIQDTSNIFNMKPSESIIDEQRKISIL